MKVGNLFFSFCASFFSKRDDRWMVTSSKRKVKSALSWNIFVFWNSLPPFIHKKKVWDKNLSCHLVDMTRNLDTAAGAQKLPIVWLRFKSLCGHFIDEATEKYYLGSAPVSGQLCLKTFGEVICREGGGSFIFNRLFLHFRWLEYAYKLGKFTNSETNKRNE